MEAAIDQKVGAFRGNPIVAQLIPQMKAKYRNGFLERAESARTKSN